MSTHQTEASNYFIKEGYSSRDVIHTRDDESGGTYWNSLRILESSIYQRPVYDLASREIQKRKPKTVADIGCGVGTKLAGIARSFPNVEFIGYDQGSSIDYCKRTHSVGSWIATDFDDPTVTPICTADIVICSDVIEHVERPERLLEFIRKTISQDGLLIISTPERDILRGKRNYRSPKREHVREWNREEFGKLMEHFGFEILGWERQFNVRPAINRFFFRELLSQSKRLRSSKYNQVFLAKIMPK